MEAQNIYKFKVKNTKGELVSLEIYKGKVLLIVNTASKCGFTPQLNDLEETFQKFKSKDFAILGFPSDDFGGQEPLSGEALSEFCSINYGVTFDIFEKIHVKGDEQHELYNFLSNKSENGKINSTPKWNFHKYLVDKEGKLVDYYYSTTNPSGKKISKAIESLI